MHRQVLFPQSRLLGLTILLAGVDGTRVPTIQAQCHVIKTFFLSGCMINGHTQVFYHPPLSYVKMPGDAMFSLFDVPSLSLS